ncbi:LSU ribosomal protein L29p (L35e) [uncultured Gammaproteobacteria bacterium]|jgi:large subunit ribosomal protein L29|nr:LSU ribosomal protein L29p (L35e) [Bathymodiolus brooksi thiotrophic gill symbiont]CAC9580105.1 LSU ribosomal protein L29p (L35e) [uncultured Gammaproteobacteria bacterium]CAB9545038.1 LSU ribosomal protein L29p (L35e) [Bathymodiolus brooksi thiotrophic gill symbiont]CAC9585216.1 LSU ribosomal protein L29p (L35e) [uncultured Gammaproteobacteria bacterium]CAC9606014.1 LSU ribosomal protein L29p (L35e) [uncultured Gammaproteobacteria bacterium]
MDVKELRSQDTSTLNETLMTLLKDHFELRMKHKSAQLDDASKLSKIKKSIARVKTIIREKRV